jgi:hypothetical protein
MLQKKLPTTRMTAMSVCAAALVASLIGVGTAAADGVTELKFTNKAAVRITIKSLTIDYWEDIDPGDTVTVPSSKLQNIDRTYSPVGWVAYRADTQAPCDMGVVVWDVNGAATVKVGDGCGS